MPNIQDFADLVLSVIQEEMQESIDDPWVVNKGGGCLEARFSVERINNALHVVDYWGGSKFIIEVRNA
jgi:hypothetical protein